MPTANAPLTADLAGDHTLSPPRVVFVTGCPRTGVSSMGMFVRACNPHLQFPDTPRCHSLPLAIQLFEPLLREMHCDSRGQGRIPGDPGALYHGRKPGTVRRDVMRILQIDTRREGWGVKESRILLFWELFLEAFPEAVWVVTYRHPDEIVASCLHTRYMTGRSDTEGWRRWIAAQEYMTRELMHAARDRVVRVCPSDMFRNHNTDAARAALSSIGLLWDDEKRAMIFPTKET